MSQLSFDVNERPIRLYAQEPPGNANTLRPAIVLLHGAGGGLEFWASHFQSFLPPDSVALYAPHYFDRTGTVRADLTTIADGVHVPQWLDTIDQALRFVAGRPNVDPRRIALAGISLGGFLALALAANFSASAIAEERERLRAVLEISGGLVDPYASMATTHFPPTLILHGARDTVVPVQYARQLAERLTSLEVAHRVELLEEEGHWFTVQALPRLLRAASAFLDEHVFSPVADPQAL